MKFFLLVQAIALLVYGAKPPIVSKKSKLCGNDQCDEVLFKAKVKRVMGSSHEAFLSLTEGALIDVTAVKFSDRTDLMEGMLADGRKGNFYIGAIDIGPYVEFLRNAIAVKKEMLEISQDRADVGAKKLLGAVRADLHLVRDYNVQSRRYAQEQNIPEPDPLPVPEMATSNRDAHGHSHNNAHVGHSHSGAHAGHSHEATHTGPSHVTPPPSHGDTPTGHSHGHPSDVHDHGGAGNAHVQENTPSGNFDGAASNTSISGQMDTAQKPHLPSASETIVADTNVLGQSETPSVKVDPSEMDREIAKLIARDEALLRGDQTEKKQDTQANLSPSSKTGFKVNPGKSVHSSLLHEVPSTARLSSGDILSSTTSTIELQNPTMSAEESVPSATLGLQGLSTQHATVATGSVTQQASSAGSTENPQKVESSSKSADVSKPVQDVSPPLQPVPETASVPPLDVVATHLVVDRKPLPLTATPPSTGEFASTFEEGNADLQISGSTLHPIESVTPSGGNVVSEVSTPTPSASSEYEYCTREECDVDREAPSSDAGSKLTPEAESGLSTTENPVHIDTVVSAKHNLEISKVDKAAASSDVVGGFLKSLTTAIRAVPFLNNVDDAGIGFIVNLLFLVAAVLIHFTSYFLSDCSDAVTCDRMITHDLATKCKFLEEQNKIKDIEVDRLNSVAARFQGDVDETAELRKDMCLKEMEVQKLLRVNESLKIEIEDEHRVRVSLEGDLDSKRKHAVEAEERAAESRRLLVDSERAHSHTVNELSSTRKALERLEKDLHDERRIHEETVVELKKAKDAASKLQIDLCSANEEIKKLTSEKNNVELENATLSSMIEDIERNRKEGSAGESGGSGGWSDFGDDIGGEADEDKERTPASSTVTVPVASTGADVREAAKLRVHLKKAEQELDTTRMALDYEKEERRKVESKLASLESELDRKTREVEERERDRSRADERCNELLSIMKDNNAKARETESLRDKLRDDITKLQTELASVVEDKRKKEEKIHELEAELKRIRNEHLKLETRRFNEVLDLKHRLDVMQTNHQVAQPAPGYDLLNQSASSLERDAVSSHISLWEEAPRSMSRNRTTSPEEEFLFGTFPHSKKGSIRSRRSDRIARDHSPSDGEKRKERKDVSHRRVRSRSHGRQLWNGGLLGESSRYVPVESVFSNPEFDVDTLNRRHSRSTHVYYSSGGSNGGRSPPPEMPLLSAVPPPGLKKPAGKRAVDLGLEFKST